jgi:hypothetical protein
MLLSFKDAVTATEGLSNDLFVPDAWQPGVMQTLASFIRMYGVGEGAPQEQAKELLKSMLDTAWKHRTRIEKLSLSDSKMWLSIVGLDADTRVTMQIVKREGKPWFDLGELRNDWTPGGAAVSTGDNTVSYPGAQASPISDRKSGTHRSRTSGPRDSAVAAAVSAAT